MRNTFIIAFFFISFWFASLVFSSTTPRCTSPYCCNYCNMTYSFPDNDCSEVLTALIVSANTTEYFDYQSSVEDPPSVYIVHTTISDCCPPGYVYYEDGKINNKFNFVTCSVSNIIF